MCEFASFVLTRDSIHWLPNSDSHETKENRIIGTAPYRHEVPTELGLSVLMRDAGHTGTEITLTENGDYRFRDLDFGRTYLRSRCVLIRLRNVDPNDLPEPCGYDLTSGDGMAMHGLTDDEEPPTEADVLWDSDKDS